MINAKIIDNKPFCKKCDNELKTETRDLRQVRYKGESLTLFTKHCYHCGEDCLYLADVLLEKTTRYEVKEDYENIGD